MQINKKDLEAALAIVKPALASKEVIEQSTSFAFLGDYVVTYNDEISIVHPIKGLDLEGAIKADELFLFLKKLTKDEIDVDIKGNEIQFKAGRTKAWFALQAEISLPLDDIQKKKKWKALPADFAHYLSLATGACSTDMSTPLLTAVNVEADGTILGSDNYKVMVCEIGAEMPVDTFLLPAASALEVIKLKPTKVYLSDSWVHFKNEEGTEISCRIFNDKHPAEGNRPTCEGIEISFPRTIEEILDRISVFAKREHALDESITISIGGNKMRFQAKSDTGRIEEKVNLKYDDDELSFAVTPYLLRDIIKEASVFVLGNNMLKFEGAGWVYITALRHS